MKRFYFIQVQKLPPSKYAKISKVQQFDAKIGEPFWAFETKNQIQGKRNKDNKNLFSNESIGTVSLKVVILKFIQVMVCGKLINPHFIGVTCFIAFNYFVFVFQYMLELKPGPYPVLLVIFHLFFLLLLWSMGKAILGDPGRVPIYWGFFAEQSQNRKRRYCLLCHSFKPERCHHCSTCQRCVLNMDHHCPWIANCVGFSNRKFFMLFLFYIILTLIFSLAVEIPLFIQNVMTLVNNKEPITIGFIIRAVGLAIQASFFVVISMFFRFHVELVLTNSSTLDNLERQRNPNAGPNVYDVGAYQNFLQVFGTNSCLWLLPVPPVNTNRANGVVWPKNQ